jgi:CRISPR-associated protein Csy2
MFFLIKNIDIRGANALSAYPVASGVSPLAVAGFVRNLAIMLGVDSSENLGFSIVHHNTHIKAEDAGFKPIPLQKIGALLTCSSAGKSGSPDYSSGSMSLSLQPVIECDTHLSVIIDFADIAVTKEEINNIIPTMRIAGGQVQSCDAVYEYEDFGLAIKRVGPGYAYTDRSDDLLKGEAKNRVMAFVENLYPTYLPSDHAVKIQSRENKSAWIVPFNLGWLPLTDFKQSAGSRKGFDHAYVEPLVGLVELLPARKAIYERTPIIWKTKKMNDAYVVTTNV